MNVFFLLTGAFLVLTTLLVVIFNRFAQNRNRVKDAWSNVDVALKKRHDLIPNLVNTVEGYAAHERQTLEDVTMARNNAISMPSGNINAQIKAENQLQQGLDRLFALREDYPALKADGSFLYLQKALSAVEENLERSRRYYNSTVRENNTYGESFPGAVFAGVFRYQHFDFFEGEAAGRETINLNFKKQKQ